MKNRQQYLQLFNSLFFVFIVLALITITTMSNATTTNHTTTGTNIVSTVTPKLGLSFTTITPNKQAESTKSKVIVDRLELINSETEFSKNIPYTEITSLIQSYSKSLQILNQSKQVNTLTLEITYTPNNQTFNINTTVPVSENDIEIYKKVFESLKTIKKPDVKEKLSLMIYAHIEPIN